MYEDDEYWEPTGNETPDFIQDIRNADPDGGYVQPTEADYKAFERWAIERFGQAAWNFYNSYGEV